MPDGADAKAEFAETLMKFRVSLQQVYQCIRIGRLYNVRQIFNVINQRSVILWGGLKGPKC